MTAGDLSTTTLGDGSDTVTGGDGDLITAGNGNDKVTAGASSIITLGDGHDTVSAGANSPISLGNGNDTVYAGASDLITLGTGNDTVAFGVSPSPATIGNETVNGFNPAHDVIDFNIALFANYAAVMGAERQVGSGTVITVDATNSV